MAPGSICWWQSHCEIDCKGTSPVLRSRWNYKKNSFIQLLVYFELLFFYNVFCFSSTITAASSMTWQYIRASLYLPLLIYSSLETCLVRGLLLAIYCTEQYFRSLQARQPAYQTVHCRVFVPLLIESGPLTVNSAFGLFLFISRLCNFRITRLRAGDYSSSH